ncbi:MAG: hypothetical protein CL910_15410 [Deltaproteobacteria bacterium]|jgi:hypothetical protein|nr:hypothetical protein [Deltaproteobacteria bacterium]
MEKFVDASLRGLDRGLRDAANLLVAFGARRDQVAAERAETFRQVRDKVTEFAEQQIEEAGRQRSDHQINLPELDLLGTKDSD